jgi:large subunit ribosomal protein L17
MAVIELCEAITEAAGVVKEAEKARSTRTAAKKAPAGRTREIAEDAADESPTAASVAAETAALEGDAPEEGLAALGLSGDEVEAAAETEVADEPEAGAELGTNPDLEAEAEGDADVSADASAEAESEPEPESDEAAESDEK